MNALLDQVRHFPNAMDVFEWVLTGIIPFSMEFTN